MCPVKQGERKEREKLFSIFLDCGESKRWLVVKEVDGRYKEKYITYS
jgi:hypothetical protein